MYHSKEVTRFDRDDLGHLIRAIGADGYGMTATLDSLRRVSQVTDPMGRSMGFSYDQHGQLTGISSPVGTFEYGYDDRGHLRHVTGPEGETVSMDYDGSHQIRVHLADGGSVVYLYDAAGRVVGVRDPLGGTTVYTYDTSGRVIRTTSLPPAQ